MTLRTLFPVLASGLFTATTSSGAVLATYSFNSGSLAPTSSDPGVVAGTVGIPGDFEVSTSTNMIFYRASNAEANLGAALTSGDYLEVTIRAAVGQTLSLQSFVFDHISSNDQPPFTSNFSIFASLDGFATPPTETDALATSTGTATTTGSTTATINDDFGVSLAGSQFQNLTSATTVTFRIYGFDDQTTAGAINRIDDIRINGIIPEPSTVALSALGALALFRRRRA